ncbi:hypothetical protein HZS55_13480 [Halosimplex rubrum]|uniref:Uncharacterized protein n=1 Tax=Halosimplex rubrum TaxID=869889 RepID=A0A7D5P1E0_9EURY|nr:hypothetical protein [Halosimplex rubrum]QLH78257.1 hypothetical protein HZS55_13480 [Halosimplex rubrum]
MTEETPCQYSSLTSNEWTGSESVGVGSGVEVGVGVGVGVLVGVDVGVAVGVDVGVLVGDAVGVGRGVESLGGSVSASDRSPDPDFAVDPLISLFC